MSSSSIIRGGAEKIVPYRFTSLAQRSDVQTEEPGESSFLPLTFAEASPAGLPPSESSVPDTETPDAGQELLPPPGMLLIPEEELRSRLDDARRQGSEEGKQQAEQGLSNVFQSLRRSIAELSALRERVLRESEEDLLRLSIAIARKIIQHEISTDRSLIASLISSAISGSLSMDRITIRLSPADHELVESDRRRYLGAISSETRVILASDDTLSPGDCVVESTTGVVDARIDTQLDEIFRRLWEERGIAERRGEASVEESNS